jgi:hypothetical protein
MLYLEVRLKLQKAVSLRYSLHVALRNRMLLLALGLHRKLFGQKSGPKMRLRCIAQLNVLFRLTSHTRFHSCPLSFSSDMVAIYW